MTHSITYTMTETTADAIVAKFGRIFDGRLIHRETATTISLYASNATHHAFERAIAAATPRQAALATPRQIAYLRDLIDRDYGAATTIGAAITPNLTAAEASRFIDLLKHGV